MIFNFARICRAQLNIDDSFAPDLLGMVSEKYGILTATGRKNTFSLPSVLFSFNFMNVVIEKCSITLSKTCTNVVNMNIFNLLNTIKEKYKYQIMT